MTCNATLTTATLTDDVVTTVTDDDRRGTWADEAIPDGVATVRDGDRLLRIDVTTLTCDLDAGHSTEHCSGHGPRDKGGGVDWTDGTPGAASHADNTPPADVCPRCNQGHVVGTDLDGNPTDEPCPSCDGSGLKADLSSDSKGDRPADEDDDAEAFAEAIASMSGPEGTGPERDRPAVTVDTSCPNGCGRPVIGLHICTGGRPADTDALVADADDAERTRDWTTDREDDR